MVDAAISDLVYVKQTPEGIEKENFELVKVWKYDLKSEPDYDSLDRIKLNFLDKDSKPLVDCLVGIGGGSVIDFAKSLANGKT